MTHEYFGSIRLLSSKRCVNYDEKNDELIDPISLDTVKVGRLHGIRTDGEPLKYRGYDIFSLFKYIKNLYTDIDTIDDLVENLDIVSLVEPIDKRILDESEMHSIVDHLVYHESLNKELYNAITLKNLIAVEGLLEDGADPNYIVDHDSIMMMSIYIDDTEILQKLIKYDGDVNTQSSYGDSLLMKSVSLSNTELFDFLLSKEANINTVNKNHENALLWCIKTKNEYMFNILLDKGANINHKDKDDAGVFLWAIEYFETNSRSILNYLLKNNIDINEVDGDGWNGLHIAICMNNLDCVKYLIEKDINTDHKTDEGITPLIFAVYYQRLEIMDFLLSSKKININIDATIWEGKTILSISCYLGYLDIVKILLAADANINKLDDYEQGCLFWAVISKNIELVKHLLNTEELNINMINYLHQTPIMLSVYYGDVNMFNYLISKGARINISDRYSNTLLIFAAYSGSVEIVKYLIKKNIDINSVNVMNWSALMWASCRGHIDIVKELCENDADIDLYCNKKWSAIVLAGHYGYSDIVDYLLNLNAKIDVSMVMINIKNKNIRSSIISYVSTKGCSKKFYKEHIERFSNSLNRISEEPVLHRKTATFYIYNRILDDLRGSI